MEATYTFDSVQSATGRRIDDDRQSVIEGKGSVLAICFCFPEPRVVATKGSTTTNMRFTMREEEDRDNLRVTIFREKFSDFQTRAHARNRVNE